MNLKYQINSIIEYIIAFISSVMNIQIIFYKGTIAVTN